MISEPLASLLRSGRETFNSQFAAARLTYPNLDGGKFTQFLEGTIDPLLRGLSATPAQLSAWAQDAFAVGLEILGAGHGANEARDRNVERAWRELAPLGGRLCPAEGDSYLRSLTNAIYNLERVGPAAEILWIEAMRRLTPLCTNFEEWRKIGQISAWTAGMAEFREGALEVAATLPDALRHAALGGGADAREWKSLRAELAENPWCDPRTPAGMGKRGLRLEKRLGEFTGFAGKFPDLPRVFNCNNALYIRSGDECWHLLADIFGEALVRATKVETVGAREPLQDLVQLSVRPSDIVFSGQRLEISLPGQITSVACMQHTLAITTDATFAVLLLSY